MLGDEPLAERDDLGYLLRRASLRWDEMLAVRCREYGFPEVRPSFGAVLLPLFHEDGLRLGEIAHRSRLSKQTMTVVARQAEKAGLVVRERDPSDHRAYRLSLTPRSKEFRPIADQILEEMHALVERELPARVVSSLKRGLRTIMRLHEPSAAAGAATGKRS